MKLKSFTTKQGKNVPLTKITIFVGPNNTGKSQTLRDIRERLENGQMSKPVIIDSFEFDTPSSIEDFYSGIEIKDSIHNIGHKTVFGIKGDLLSKDSMELHMPSLESDFQQNKSYNYILGNITKYRVANLDSSTRLNLVLSTPSFNPNLDNPSNLIQSLFLDENNELSLIKAFKSAFDMDIKMDYSELISLCLRVGKKLPKIPEDPQQACKITQFLQKIDTQGDGFKSFVGIILGLLFSKDRIILLDEPEAFLHPAQARFLGKWIIDNSDLFQGQLLICTHNSNFLSGVLSSDKKVDIFRLNRHDNITEYNLLPPNATDNLSKSPILSSQRVIEGIFHKGVVVCEADADRAVYQSVASIEHMSNQEILFIHSHNKQTHKDVAKLLVEAKIPVALIVDIDIFNGDADLKNILEILGDNLENVDLLERRKVIAESVNTVSENEILEHVKNEIRLFSEQLERGEHTLNGAKSAYKRIEKEFTSWKDVKDKGVIGFSSDIQPTAIALINDLKAKGIFVVPVGELEGWMDLGTKKKNKWIIPALNKIHSRGCSPELRDFIKEVLAFF